MDTYNIFYADREYAFQKGDPLLGTVKANSLEEARLKAVGMGDGIGGLWPVLQDITFEEHMRDVNPDRNEPDPAEAAEYEDLERTVRDLYPPDAPMPDPARLPPLIDPGWMEKYNEWLKTVIPPASVINERPDDADWYNSVPEWIQQALIQKGHEIRQFINKKTVAGVDIYIPDDDAIACLLTLAYRLGAANERKDHFDDFVRIV